MKLPGLGAIYRSQTLEFLKPVRIGDTITAIFEVEEIDENANRIEIASRIDNQRGETVIRGKAVASLIHQPS